MMEFLKLWMLTTLAILLGHVTVKLWRRRDYVVATGMTLVLVLWVALVLGADL